jgi:hypothetical protein
LEKHFSKERIGSVSAVRNYGRNRQFCAGQQIARFLKALFVYFVQNRAPCLFLEEERRTAARTVHFGNHPVETDVLIACMAAYVFQRPPHARTDTLGKCR